MSIFVCNLIFWLLYLCCTIILGFTVSIIICQTGFSSWIFPTSNVGETLQASKLFIINVFRKCSLLTLHLHHQPLPTLYINHSSLCCTIQISHIFLLLHSSYHSLVNHTHTILLPYYLWTPHTPSITTSTSSHCPDTLNLNNKD